MFFVLSNANKMGGLGSLQRAQALWVDAWRRLPFFRRQRQGVAGDLVGFFLFFLQVLLGLLVILNGIFHEGVLGTLAVFVLLVSHRKPLWVKN